MNATFKVIFNKARGALMVVNEITSSIQAKGTKTVIATAVATLAAGSTLAGLPEGPITNDNLPTLEINGDSSETTKLISGKGETINIQTNGSVEQFLEDLKAVGEAKDSAAQIKALLDALSPEGDNKILTGVTGGYNITDEVTVTMIGMGGALAELKGDLPQGLTARLLAQLDTYLDEETRTPLQYENVGDTHIIIGETAKDGSNPLVLGVIGGDLYVGIDNFGADIDRTGSSNVLISSGNVAGVVGGSAVVVSGMFTSQEMPAGTHIAQMNGSNLTFNGTANVGGFLGGGLAVGTAGAVVESNLTQGSHITIDMGADTKAGNLDGLVMGGFGGGVALAAGGGDASVNNGASTTIDIVNGAVLGVVGGGAALAGDATMSGEGTFESLLQGIIGRGSGTATTTSGAITFNLGAQSATAAVMGGGVAVADAAGQSKADSQSIVTSVEMNFEGPASLNDEQKGALHTAAGAFLNKVKNDRDNLSIKDFAQFAGGVDIDGVHVGNLGGGAAVARGYYEGISTDEAGKAIASSTVRTVEMNLNGGYNVATAAGGLAVAWDIGGYAVNEKEAEHAVVNATSSVGTATVNVEGGENILVTAGGLAFATAGNGQNTLANATANVGTAIVDVTGGSVDGLYGAGIAIDDTNTSETNASTNVGSVTMTVSNGTVRAANVDPITGFIQGQQGGTPSRGSYVNQSAKLLGEDVGNAAILGGGIATGAGAEANVDIVTIELKGTSVVEGNVFAGGAATLGGTSTVTEATVTLDGATVTGNVYGGGLAGSPENDAFADGYKDAASTVATAVLKLKSGVLNGNVYTGGQTYGADASSSVKTARVEIDQAFDFQGQSIDGTEGESTLIFTTGYEFAEPTEGEQTVTIKGFNQVLSAEAVTGAAYEFADGKKDATFNGIFDFTEIRNGNDKTLTLENGALSIQNIETATNTFDVDGGVLALGSKASAETGLAALGTTEAKSALYLSGTVDLANKKILVGTTSDAATGVTIGADGVLIADAGLSEKEEAGAMVTSVKSSVTGEESATLHFVNVADMGKVELTTDITNVTVDNVLFEVNKADNVYSFNQITDAGQLSLLGLDDFDTDDLAQISRQDDSASELIQEILQPSGVSGDRRNAQMNAALNVAAAAGVQTAGIEGVMIGLDQVAKRASLTNRFEDGWTGFAEVSGTQLKMGGDRGALETKTQLGGVIVGGEYTQGDLTFGVLGNFGTGDVDGEGDNSGVKNDVTYYGLQAYAAKRIDRFNLVGQIGYLMTDNDISHDNGNDVNVDADVFTLGARGEMIFAINQKWSAVPYVGLNWLRVGTDGYTTDRGVRVDDVDQDLWNLPVGIAVTGECATVGGWTMKPTVDFAYIHTFGDTDLDVDTRVGTTSIGTSLDVWSENVGRLAVGFEARKDNLSLGLNLGGAFGDNDHEELYGQVAVKYLF